jgi:hypothetical protein
MHLPLQLRSRRSKAGGRPTRHDSYRHPRVPNIATQMSGVVLQLSVVHCTLSVCIRLHCRQYGSLIIDTSPSWRSRITGKYTLYRMYSLHGSVHSLSPLYSARTVSNSRAGGTAASAMCKSCNCNSSIATRVGFGVGSADESSRLSELTTVAYICAVFDVGIPIPNGYSDSTT